MAETTPLEAAERLETIDRLVLIKGIGPEYDTMRDAVKYAASYLRSIAAGEYKQVVHGHWIDRTERHGKVCFECSSCGAQNSGGIDLYCYACGAFMYAPVMRQTQAGKDDSHE